MAAAAAAMVSSPAPVERSRSPLHDHRRDGRAVLQAQDRIALPVEAGHALRVEVDFLEQHAAGGLHQLAFDLVLDDQRVHDQPGIERAIQVQDAHATRVHVDFDIGHRRAMRDQMRAQADAAAATQALAGSVARARAARLQSAARGRGLQHATPARVADVAAAEFERVDRPSCDGELVDGLFGDEGEGQIQR